MLAAGLIRNDLQAHLTLARVGEQPPSSTPTSLPVRTRTKRPGDGGETPAHLRQLGSTGPRRRSVAGLERPGPVSPRESSPVADLAIACVARESSPVGARDERFAADADRVDRIRGDRFSDGANRPKASQLPKATPAIRTNQSRGRPSPDDGPGPEGRLTLR